MLEEMVILLERLMGDPSTQVGSRRKRVARMLHCHQLRLHTSPLRYKVGQLVMAPPVPSLRRTRPHRGLQLVPSAQSGMEVVLSQVKPDQSLLQGTFMELEASKAMAKAILLPTLPGQHRLQWITLDCQVVLASMGQTNLHKEALIDHLLMEVNTIQGLQSNKLTIHPLSYRFRSTARGLRYETFALTYRPLLT